ncbi:MAG: cytochrome-c oxidase, cbb3-type subunit III [Kiloniellaceae bacterium]
MAGHNEIDEITGTETTGHEWDGIKELNTPLPRWWLWTFYASIIWAVVYWIAMPAWPLVSSHTRGVLGYASRAQVDQRVAAARAAQSALVARIDTASLGEIRKEPALLAFAMAGGRSAFAVNCSQCHGRGAAGSPGFANLNDDAWLWGGTLDAIHQTIRYGIRSDNEETRVGNMPAFVRDEVLTRDQAGDVAEYVLSLSGRAEDPAAAGRGDVGAPNLSDSIWLYGGDKATIVETVSNGRGGMMPAWTGRLDSTTVKQLAIYVHSLGGGE